MATRVSIAEVKEIFPTDNAVSPFIEIANREVTRRLSGAGLSVADLKDIELYMSAHFAAITIERGGVIEEETGRSRAKWNNLPEEGYALTRFGRIAILLDTSGILESIGKKGKTVFESTNLSSN